MSARAPTVARQQAEAKTAMRRIGATDCNILGLLLALFLRDQYARFRRWRWQPMPSSTLWVMWTRSANSHTGRRLSSCRIIGRTDDSIRPRAPTTPTFSLARKGASTDGKRSFADPWINGEVAPLSGVSRPSPELPETEGTLPSIKTTT